MYIPDHNAFFIHIPKTGGNSIEFYFLQQMGITVNERNSVTVFNSQKNIMLGRVDDHQAAHYTATQLQNNELFKNSDYVFSIVRHPFQRFVSECRWRGKTNAKDVDKILKDLQKQQDYRLYSSWDYISIAGKLAVNEVFKLEEPEIINLNLSKRFGIDFKMPHHNKSSTPDIQLTTAQKDIIIDVWQKDFEEFGYEVNHKTI